MKCVSVVTGASRGIGRACALALAREGAHVILVARSEAALQAVAREIVALGASAEAVCADVGSDADCLRIGDAARRCGAVDLLVNNAGIFRPVPFLDIDVGKHWEATIATNLTGTFLPTLRVMPYLLRSARPHIINILSVAAVRGYGLCAAYCAAKWGARGFGEALKAEFGDRLRLTAICPGPTDTNIWDDVPFSYDRGKMLSADAVATEAVKAWKSKEAPAEIVLES